MDLGDFCGGGENTGWLTEPAIRVSDTARPRSGDRHNLVSTLVEHRRVCCVCTHREHQNGFQPSIPMFLAPHLSPSVSLDDPQPSPVLPTVWNEGWKPFWCSLTQHTLPCSTKVDMRLWRSQDRGLAVSDTRIAGHSQPASVLTTT